MVLNSEALALAVFSDGRPLTPKHIIVSSLYLTGLNLNLPIVSSLKPDRSSDGRLQTPTLHHTPVHQTLGTNRCRANMAHIRQSMPDSGLGFQVKVRITFQVIPSSLGSGP